MKKEQMRQILGIVSGVKTPQRNSKFISGKINLSLRTTNDYLGILTEQGFLVKTRGWGSQTQTFFYKITEIGKHILEELCS